MARTTNAGSSPANDEQPGRLQPPLSIPDLPSPASAGLPSFQEPDMTGYLIRFSCLLDDGTASVARAFDLFAAPIGKNGRESPSAGALLPSPTQEHGAIRLWFRDPGSAPMLGPDPGRAVAWTSTGRWPVEGAAR
jgi:hypothetical protein